MSETQFLEAIMCLFLVVHFTMHTTEEGGAPLNVWVHNLRTLSGPQAGQRNANLLLTEVVQRPVFLTDMSPSFTTHPSVEFLRGQGSQSGVSVWQHTLVG